MNKLSLFSGVGGIDLAAEWAGMNTVAFCEREPFPQKVLRKHWPNIPIYDDVCTLTKERLEHDGVITASRAIDIISAGYPCQPDSYAGQRKGTADDRWLWPQVARLLSELRPNWFLGENVAGHATFGLDKVLADLENLSYTFQTFDIPAAAVNADHERRRIFIVAHTKCEGWERLLYPQLRASIETYPYWSTNALDASRNPISRLEESSGQPSLFRSDNGVPSGMDGNLIVKQLQALGNAVSPYQVYPILASIKAIDDYMGKAQGESVKDV